MLLAPDALRERSRMIHAAVIEQRYIDLMLRGEKSVESRLSINRVVPFDAVRPGERMYFKARGGGFRVTALVERVCSYEGLTPPMVERLRRRWNGRVRAEPAYWTAKSSARYATFIELQQVESLAFGPRTPPFHGRAWRVLPARLDVYPQCLAGVRIDPAGAPR